MLHHSDDLKFCFLKGLTDTRTNNFCNEMKNLIKTLDLEFTQGSNLSKSVREAVKDLIYLMSAGIIN